jgi:hypothetical protein
VEDLVVDLRAEPLGGFEAHADLDALERLDRADRAHDPAVEAAVDRHAAAEADGAAEDVALDDAAGGVFCYFCAVDEIAHLVGRRCVGAIDVGGFALDDESVYKPTPCIAWALEVDWRVERRDRRAHFAHLSDEPEDFDVECLKQ